MTDDATRAPASPPLRRRRLPLLLGALALLALLAAAWWAQRPSEVNALLPPHGPLERTLQFTARVETPARVELGATLTGRVHAVAVREGDRFAAGEALVQLEDDELRAAVAQAQAALAQARADLAAQAAVARPSANAALSQAEANAAAAARELARSRELLAQGFVSQARVDDALRAQAVAQAQVDAARAEALANRAGGVQAEAATARVQAATAAAEAAAARLDQATLRAPAPGRVLVRSVEPGQIVQPGRALLSVAVDGPRELVAPVDERFLSTLAVGQAARVVADAYPAQPFAATVTRLAPSVDAQRGAVEVHLRPGSDAPDFLRENMTLSVEVVTGERAHARLLPLAALRGEVPADAHTAQVLVVEDGRAALREVQLGLRTLDQVELAGGLAEGELVLLDPSIAPGQRVKPRRIDLQQALGGGRGRTSRDSMAPVMNAAGR